MSAEHSNFRCVVTVLIALALAGAMIGGLAGATTVAIASIHTWCVDVEAHPECIDSIAISDRARHVIPGFSAVFGFVAAPLAGWLLLRRVPLGQAFIGLALGTILGGLMGWDPHFGLPFLMHPTTAAGLGFLVSAILLRVTSRSAT